MKKLIVEFIGTFVLVFTVGNAVISQQPLAALAIGAALMITIYAGYPVSGAHYNPAVSLAVWRRGALAKGDLLPYMGAQLLGAIVGALMVGLVQGPGLQEFTKAMMAESMKGKTSAGFVSVFVAELIWTTLLAFVVLHVTTTKKAAGNAYFGLAIGLTVVSGAISLGGVSDSFFNPGVFVGLCLMGVKSWTGIITFWGAQFLGGIVAAEVFKRTNPDEA